MHTRRPPYAYSLVGMLITMACIVVLFAVLMNGLNKSVTGQGSAKMGTVRSAEDQVKLYGIMQGMILHSNENRDRFPIPSVIDRSEDISHDTTANLYSAMIMLQLVSPESLVASNEFSGYIEVDYDYDYTQYDPGGGLFWDPAFEADLEDLSNASWGHMPLFGERLDRSWAYRSATCAVIGQRGPEDGRDDPNSYTYGRNGQWAGHMAYGDGRIDFVEAFTPTGSFYERDGERYPDNLFAMDDGPAGRDAIISFTEKMDDEGPWLQWD